MSETAQLFADEHNLKYIETSAKENLNIDKAFMQLVQEVIQVRAKNLQEDQIVNLKQKETKRGGCC